LLNCPTASHFSLASCNNDQYTVIISIFLLVYLMDGEPVVWSSHVGEEI